MALFWLSDGAWAAIELHLPKNQLRARRVVRLPGRIPTLSDGLQPVQLLVSSGLLAHVAGSAGGYRRGDEEHRGRKHLREGAARRIRRKRGALAPSDRPLARVNHQGSRAHRRHWPPYALMLTAGNIAPALLERAGRMRYLLGDKGEAAQGSGDAKHRWNGCGRYDADRLRRLARDAGAVPLIPGRRNRNRTIRYDKQRYAGRHLIENAFCRLKDFRRIDTRYDKLAANFLSGVALATALAFWL